MVKIQCKVVETKFGKVPAELLNWQDMENMPDLHDRAEAESWLTTNKADELHQYGIEFQIVEIEAVTDSQMSQHVS
jgi:hypothetical protein